MLCHVHDIVCGKDSAEVVVPATLCTLSSRMSNFVIVPRHRSYWIYEVRGESEHRTLGCFSCEDEAVKRLRQLRSTEDAREQRLVAQEASRFSQHAWA